MVSGFGAIDRVGTGVNKATGLEGPMRASDADPAGILAFGDGETTWRCSATRAGVCLSNAPEVVRNAADGVIGSNEEQAVPKGIWSSSLTVWKLRNRRFLKETRRSVCMRGGADLVNLR